MRSAFAIVAVLLLGAAALWAGTDGFRAFTAEEARRIAVAEHPRPLPPVMLEDQQGRAFNLRDYRGKVVLLEFVYTRCPDLCAALGTSFERIREHISDSKLQNRVALFSVSFDPGHDGPDELAAYADRFGGPDAGWRFARPRDERELQALLEVCGVVVKPDGIGGYQHNAAIHMIDSNGNLVRILDYDAVDETLAQVRRLI